MKHQFRKYGVLLAALFGVVALSYACKNDKNTDGGDGSTIYVLPESLSLNYADTTFAINVTASDAWYVSDYPSWVTVEPAAGDKGSVDVSVTVAQNEQFEQRDEILAFKAGNATLQVPVSQDACPMVRVSQSSFAVSSAASQIKFSVQAGGTWNITGAAEWVSLSTEGGDAGAAFVTVDIAANTLPDARKCVLTLSCKGETAKVTVEQAQKNKIILSERTSTLPHTAGSVEVTVASNIDYTYTVTEDWITPAQTKSMTDSKVTFNYTENTLKTTREAYVIFKGDDAVDTLTVTQQSILSLYNLYGYVTDNTNTPVAGVSVSDGALVTQTDSDGFYGLMSNKQMGYVFMSIPSGYEALTLGTAKGMPLFHSSLTSDVYTSEQVDFSLTKVEGGNDNHAVFFWTDSHFINRKRAVATATDMARFKNYFETDMVSEAKRLGCKVYSVHLGDITWDAYWYKDNAMTTVNYTLRDYYQFNRNFSFHIFHAQGNHDNDPKLKVEENCQQEFVKYLSPTYYSFNIGKVHYMVLDNNQYNSAYFDDAGTLNRDWNYTYKGTSNTQVNQWQWIQNDVKYLPKGTKIVICQHVGLMSLDNNFNTSLSSMSGASQLLNVILKDFNVEIMIGHSHVSQQTKYINSGREIREHRVPATCTVMWHNDHHKGNTGVAYDQCGDGSPAGYYVLHFDGTTEDHYLKGFEIDHTRQMEMYDLATFEPEYLTPLNYNQNMVIANIWGYEDGWTVSATENGSPISIVRIVGRDPNFYRWFQKVIPDLTGYEACTTRHLFKIVPQVSGSTITVKVVDRFGHTYTDSVVRSN